MSSQLEDCGIDGEAGRTAGHCRILRRRERHIAQLRRRLVTVLQLVERGQHRRVGGGSVAQAAAASGVLQAQQGGVVPVGRLWGVSRRGRIGCCADYMCRYGGRRRGQSARGEACTKETIAIARGACLYRNRLRSRLLIYE